MGSSSIATRWKRAAAVLAVVVATVVPAAAAAAAEAQPGAAVWVGANAGYAGAGYHDVYLQAPSDPQNPGIADFGAYCIEHQVDARPNASAILGDPSSFLGSNLYADPVVQAKVAWVISHSYPAIGLTELADDAGVPSLTVEEATQATQYAIWRYTDVGYDADWAEWVSPNSESTYWYLLAGANADTAATPPPAAASIAVSVAAPTSAGTAGTLYGPFTVSTNQATARVTTTSANTITDATGAPVDVDAVVDGQQLYLDLRDQTTAGAATIMATVAGASGTGLVISTPLVDGETATADSHAQSMILVAAATATTSASADGTWQAAPVATTPTLATTLVDSADQDHVLAWSGGTLVDTVAYTGLAAGQQYTVSGELMRKADATPTGITGSTTFTPASSEGTVIVTFTVPAGHAGQTLVAFEHLYSGAAATGSPVAEHTDIADAAQTVVVDQQPASAGSGTNDHDDTSNVRIAADAGGTLAHTGGDLPLGLAGLGVLALLSGAALLWTRHRAAVAR